MKKFITFVLFALFISACGGKNKIDTTLNQGKLDNQTHKNNSGKIAFMDDWITIDNFKQSDFVQEITLNNSSDFGFRMFLGKTLTYYLNQLEPELSVTDLCNKGNFQLTFFVDNKQVYQHNLPTGAGSCDYKNSATVYGIPLANKNNPDHWGRFLWLRFMKKNGGQEALSGGHHLFKIVIRPYIKNKQLKVGEVIAQGEVNLLMQEIEINDSKISIQTIADTNKWQISSALYNRDLIKSLNKKILQRYFKDITSIVVIKNGQLLIEEYFNGASRKTLHDTRSVGKTIASSLVGLAIKEGYIKSEKQTLQDFYNLQSYNNYSPEKERVTIKSLLTMSSGFAGSDMDLKSPGNEENMYPTSNWVRFALDLPMDKTKTIGKNWDYFTAGVVLLGDILNKSVANGLENYANEKLFEPLAITTYQWQYTPTGVPNTAGSFQMSSLDKARWGQLYLDSGMFAGKQILPEAWVEKSLSKQITLPDLENEYYGYLFWNKTYTVNEKPIEAYYASGNGGNKIMIFKELSTIIILTATAYNQPYSHSQSNEIIEKYILPSLIEL